MEQQKVDFFLISRSEYFPAESMLQIREKLMAMDEDRFFILQSMNFTSPIIALVLSLVVGNFGIDRFYVGDTGLGIIKLLTCGGMGIWTVIDWFLIMGKAKERNLNRLMMTF